MGVAKAATSYNTTQWSAYPAAPAWSLVANFHERRAVRPLLAGVERVRNVLQRLDLLQWKLGSTLAHSTQAFGVFLGGADEARVDAGPPGPLDAIDVVDQLEVRVQSKRQAERQAQQSNTKHLQRSSWMESFRWKKVTVC